MHARAVSMTPARAVAPAPAGGRARVANAHAAGSGNLSGRATNAKSLGNGNARVSLGSGPRRAARRAPAPARAELTDAQDAGPRRAARRGPDRRDTRAFASPTLVLTLFALPERFHEPAEWAFAMRARPPAVAGARARAGGMDTARACIFSMRATDRGSSGRALTCDPSVPVSGCFFAQKRIR